MANQLRFSDSRIFKVFRDFDAPFTFDHAMKLKFQIKICNQSSEFHLVAIDVEVKGQLTDLLLVKGNKFLKK